MTIDTKKTTKGLLGTKLGMTQVWDANNKLIPVTVIEISPNVVTQLRTPEVDGYSAVQIAYGQIDPRKANKPATGHFAKAGVTPRRHVTEVRTADAADYTLGQELAVDIFEAGKRVEVGDIGLARTGVRDERRGDGGEGRHGQAAPRAPGRQRAGVHGQRAREGEAPERDQGR